MRKRNMPDDAPAEEGADATLGAVEELIRHDDVERTVLLLETADGARREDPLDPKHLEAVDVGAKIQLRGQQPVPRAVPREKRDTLAAQRRNDVRAGRFTERRGNDALFTVGQFAHVIEA